MPRVASTVTTLRSTIAKRRSTRHEQQLLERELAGYDTPAARAELAAILGRHSADEIAPIDSLLTRQALARHASV